MQIKSFYPVFSTYRRDLLQSRGSIILNLTINPTGDFIRRGKRPIRRQAVRNSKRAAIFVDR